MSTTDTSITPFSRAESYERNLAEIKKQQAEMVLLENEQREKMFNDYFENNRFKEDSIFQIKSVKFSKFSHKRIKFYFNPNDVTPMVSGKLIFFISLKSFKLVAKYHWRVKRDYVPADLKNKIYQLFFTQYSFAFDDSNIIEGILNMWEILLNWTINDAKLRIEREKLYREGTDMFLYEDDELFLTEEEIAELHHRRELIWQRMLPPPPPVNLKNGGCAIKSKILI